MRSDLSHPIRPRVVGYTAVDQCPTPDSVSIHFELEDGPDMVLRFTTAKSIDDFIDCLRRQKQSVWPTPKTKAEPMSYQQRTIDQSQILMKDGMTLRDYFAGQAIIGLFAATAHPQNEGIRSRHYPDAAIEAYRIADAMVAASMMVNKDTYLTTTMDSHP